MNCAGGDNQLRDFLQTHEAYYDVHTNTLSYRPIHHLIINALSNMSEEKRNSLDIKPLKCSVESICDILWNNNNIAMLHLKPMSAYEILNDHKEELLSLIENEMIEELNAIHQVRRTGFQLSDALLAITASDSIKTIIDADNSSGNHLWENPIIVSILLLAIAVAVWLFCARSKQSGDFKLIAKYQDSTWAQKLCKSGPSQRVFSIADAWGMVTLSSEEKNQAIQELGKLDDFTTYSYSCGASFDSSIMIAEGESGTEYIFRNVRSGLSRNGKLIEKAFVDAGSSDYVAVKTLISNPLTHILLDIAGIDKNRIPTSFKLKRRYMREFYLQSGVDDLFSDWLEEFVSIAPSHDLSLVDVSINDKYSEKHMLNTEAGIVNQANATVQKIFHKGIIRNGKVLLRAKVQALETTIDRYGDA